MHEFTYNLLGNHLQVKKLFSSAFFIISLTIKDDIIIDSSNNQDYNMPYHNKPPLELTLPLKERKTQNKVHGH